MGYVEGTSEKSYGGKFRMKREEIARLYEFEKTYWWHVGRRYIIKRILEKYLNNVHDNEILDIGCGTGENIRLLKDYGHVVGMDSSREAIEICRENGLNDVFHSSNINEIGLHNKCFDIITAFDVLEHLDDDVEFLKEIKQYLMPGGRLILSVPAYRFLWSEHDEVLHHRRRYMASELHEKVTRAGYTTIKRSYVICFSFPLIMGYRLFRGIFPRKYGKERSSYVILPSFLNRFFIFLLKIESWLLRGMDLPIGTSVMLVAEIND